MERDVAVADDEQLIALAREGVNEAYGELYRRHASPASSYATRLVGCPDTAHDVVAEAFARILAVLQRGRGPATDFLPYLMRAVRNVAFDRRRRDKGLEFTDQVSVFEREAPVRDVVLDGLELELVQRAFHGLPERWRRVLWLTCVEELDAERASRAMAMSRNSLTSLAYRAREGLRQAYLRACLPSVVEPSCAPTVDRLPGYVRGSLGPSLRIQVQQHVARCPRCERLLDEVRDVNGTLREALIPSPRAARSLRAAPAQGSTDRPAPAAVRSTVTSWAPGRVA